MSDKISIGGTKAKSGEKKQVTVYKGYPYIIFSYEDYNFKPGDKFILSSDDNSYLEEVTFAHAEKKNGYMIIWFPLPKSGKKYALQIKYSNPQEGDTLKEYFLFRDEVLTLIDDEKASEDKLYLRGGN